MLYWYLLIFWRLLLKLICIRRRQYSVFREFMRDGSQAHIQLNVHMEDGYPDGGLFWVNHIRGFFFIFPVPPIGAAPSADGQTDLDARLPAPVCVFDNLLTLALGAPRQDRTDQP